MSKLPLTHSTRLGRKFGELTVIAIQRKPQSPRHYQVRVRCACGWEKEMDYKSAERKYRCGKACPVVPKKKKLLKTEHELYQTWRSMLMRCLYADPSSPVGRYWRGRGISVCARWRQFENFLADMGPRPPGTSLDRINPDCDYEPGNCRWATRAEQAANRRPKQQVITQAAKPVNEDRIMQAAELTDLA